MPTTDIFRMVFWLVAGLCFYALTMLVGADAPQAQVILQKLGNATLFAWLGYWIAPVALGRIDRTAGVPAFVTNLAGIPPVLTAGTDDSKLPRATLMGCVILAGALEL